MNYELIHFIGQIFYLLFICTYRVIIYYNFFQKIRFKLFELSLHFNLLYTMASKVTYEDYLRFINNINLQPLPTQTPQPPLENEATEVFIYRLTLFIITYFKNIRVTSVTIARFSYKREILVFLNPLARVHI